ncbi:WAT1-related protein At1g43650-like isoform X1 [Mangifera indica]|uniref:WAT1-related protein At1g43650-like isoform X1 n=1 Tax=Mangifera indica TaxID=29780 RepID=UPI001CFAEE17|nr:WAT1-related protein At1g43650-like isoform X1 [Mangifera indica]
MVQMKPYMALLLVELSYAGMALLSKAAVAGGISPSVFVVYRQALASLALAPFAFFLESNETSPLSYYLLCKIFLLALIGLTLSLNLYLVGINYTTATFASAIPNTLPATTFVLAALLRMESVSIRHIYGIAKVLGSVVSVSGALVFALVKGPSLPILHWHANTPHSSGKHPSLEEWIKGALIMISANTFCSLWLVLQGIIVKQYPAKIRLTTLQCFFSCIQSAIWAAVSERHNPSAWKLGWNIDLLSVAYCGVVVNGITYLLQVWAIEKKGPVFAALFTPVALIVTAIFSAFFFKEILYWGSVAGAVLLVVGLYSVLWGKNKEAKTVTNNEENPETEAETTTKP